MSIVVRTLSDQVYGLVRERILSGQIAPGGVIRQDALAAELGVSKIPLREAMARLEQDGLLTSHANRGFFVAPLSAGEAEEVFALRLKIEPEAAALASQRADDDDRVAARMALMAMGAQTDQQAPEAVHLNREFHMGMVRPSGLMVTTQLIERLHVLAERYVRVHLEPRERHLRAADEHHALLEAWLAGDAVTVERLVHDHIAGALTDLREQLGRAAD
ncbi:GntR family transcriptional regulator [Caulobacter sp. NIBR2454]|uniref:GntR family transcriptional regulator n=1 Tax=Caulobacter sp. NIBR2454 TaxID=3015996 RepID=UPI0022B63456|nr:GntR family transcriptional regulator [Caulobacter sp. NIBR2454]